jgi:hypothetical protein
MSSQDVSAQPNPATGTRQPGSDCAGLVAGGGAGRVPFTATGDPFLR